MTRGGNRRLLGRAAAPLAAALAALTSCVPTEHPTAPCSAPCTIGTLGTARSIRVGAAVTAGGLADPAYAAAVVANFNAVTPEFDLKWRVTHPTATTWNWTGADTILAFAEAHHLAVRGHTLLWSKESANPPWLIGITDPAAFRAAVLDSITTEVSHYAGRIRRWDVVNEPLASSGSSLDDNVFLRRLGPDYVELALRTAHAADPSAELWISESGLEYGTSRADAFIALLDGLIAKGVPLHGVSIEAHLLSPTAIPAGRLASVVTRLRSRNLQVALTELDVPTGPTRDEQAQVAAYRQTVGECLQNGCGEVTTWGVSDSATWLDDPATRADLPVLRQYPAASRPLLLDEHFATKPAYVAMADELRRVTTG